MLLANGGMLPHYLPFLKASRRSLRAEKALSKAR